MDVTLSLPLLVGLVSMPAVIPLLLQHIKRFEQWIRGRSGGSPYPLVAVAVSLLWVVALDRSGLLEDELGAESLNGWAVALVGLAVGAIVPLGYDGWRRLRPGAPSK